MGLFNHGNKESDDERFERYKQEIIDANYLISLELAVGTHGADEIVAGAMIGETGKLIGMANYGKTIWESTTIQLFDGSFQVHYNGSIVGYDTILGFDRGKLSWNGREFVIHTTYGDWWFRADSVFAEAVMAVINALREHYLNNLEEAEDNVEKEKTESDIDRLIQLGEMHEKGLLSDEEFISMKQKLMGSNDENQVEDDTNSTNTPEKRICENCGAEIVENANFCTDCGKPI